MLQKEIKDREARFNPGFALNNCKQNRKDFQVNLRKTLREQNALKSRNIFQQPFEKLEEKKETHENLSSAISQLRCISIQLKNEKVDFSVLQKDFFPLIKQYLNEDSAETVINECLRVLIDLSLINQPSCDQLIDSLINKIFDQLDRKSPSVLESVVWLLANHSLSTYEARKTITDHEKLPKILKFCQIPKSTLGSSSFRCISNLTRAKPQITSSRFSLFLELFLKSLPNLANEETQEEVLWAIKSLKRIFSSFSAFFNTSFLKSLFKFSNSFNASLQLPALKIVSNLLRQNLKTAELKSCNLILILTTSLNSKSSRVLKTAGKAFCEVLRSEVYTVKDLLVKGVVDKIFESIPFSGLKVHQFFSSVLQIMVEDSDEISFSHLLNDNIVQVLSSFLTSSSDEVKISTLRTLISLVMKSESNCSLEEFLKLTQDFNQACGFEHLEALALHKTSLISKLASSVLEIWFLICTSLNLSIMELPKLQKHIIDGRLKRDHKDNSTLVSFRVPTPQEKYTKIYNLQGNQNANLLLTYTQRMEKFKSDFNRNRLVRSTKRYLSTRRKVNSIFSTTPTNSSHLNSYKLSYSP